MRLIILVFNILGLIATLIWLIVEESWEALAASLLLVGALVPQIFNKGLERKSDGKIIMKQKGGKKSSNYQSAGDIVINEASNNEAERRK